MYLCPFPCDIYINPALLSIQKTLTSNSKFGLGYNSCPGRNVANLELNKIAATLTRDFDFELVDPDKEWRYHTLFIAVPYGWPVYVRRRGVRGREVSTKRDEKAEV